MQPEKESPKKPWKKEAGGEPFILSVKLRKFSVCVIITI